MGLLLRAQDVVDLTRWRWLLLDEASGEPLADYSVHLDRAASEYDAFEKLYSYVRWRVEPDRQVESEAQLIDRVGAWIGAEVLGRDVGRAIVAQAPVTVRVQVPREVEFLLFRPLELAQIEGKPLAARGDVSLVFDVDSAAAIGKDPVGETLRMLAVFSLPTDTSALALRRERYELTRLVRRIASRKRRAVRLEVLQYGVTRERLKRTVDSGGGWDMLHLSGHGGAGEFLLEKPDGSLDPVATSELTQMLWPARRRLKLAVISACESAAATTAETLRWLRLDDAAEQLEQEARGEPTEPVLGLAVQMAREMDCAVVAMRYPVADDYAIDFSDHLYDRLLDRDQALDAAMCRAVRDAAGEQPSAARPALSKGTPTLLGARAVGLHLIPPVGEPNLDLREARLFGFPDEPERFVGRSLAMANASRALAPQNEHTAVLFHGMAGAGKTACALELAYRHQNAFGAFAFWEAPKEGGDWQGALADLAAKLEIQLRDFGFSITDKITDSNQLPRLTDVLNQQALLLVLDNLETLLTPDGAWRDPRWSALLSALTEHHGESRVVMTSRVRPSSLSVVKVAVQNVHALSRDESALLARELPNLRALLHADGGPVRGHPGDIAADRELVRRVLHIVQGHPELLNLANGIACDRNQLQKRLDAAEAMAATAGAPLHGFFTDGVSDLTEKQFIDALAGWTRGVITTLSDTSRLLLEFLCCMEENDRWSYVVAFLWADLWHRLERLDEPPQLPVALAPLVQTALIHPESASGDDSVYFRLHPAIVETVCSSLDSALRTTVDNEMGAYWRVVYDAAHEGVAKGSDSDQSIVRAGLAAAPYLIRLGEWKQVGELLNEVLVRDHSPKTVQSALPHLRRIAEELGTPEALGTLAFAVTFEDSLESELLFKRALDQAVVARDFGAASSLITGLINVLRRAGRMQECLALIDRKLHYTTTAGLGPWNQFADRAQRLLILQALGDHNRVLTEVEEISARMRELPEEAPSLTNRTFPFNVRELVFKIGRDSAYSTHQWERSLALNAEIVVSIRDRGGSDYAVASSRREDVAPLLRLDRLTEAEQLLDECQRIFESEGSTYQLGCVFDGRARLESQRSRPAQAVSLASVSLRFSYVRPIPHDIAGAHGNLANYLKDLGEHPKEQRAHRLAGTLIARLGEELGRYAEMVRALAAELPGASPKLPRTLAVITQQVEGVQGVQFGALVAELCTDKAAVDTVLDAILRDARVFAEPRRIVASLPETSRLLLRFLWCLEEYDRWSHIVEANWGPLWRRLGHHDEPPVATEALGPLVECGLVHTGITETGPRQAVRVGAPGEDGEAAQREIQSTSYQLHSGVAETVSECNDPAFQAAVDMELGAYWYAGVHTASALQSEGSKKSKFLADLCLAAAPYITRLGEWDAAANLLGSALLLDRSPSTVDFALPLMRRIAEESGTAENVGILAKALEDIDPHESELLLEEALNRALRGENFHLATALTGSLINILTDAGRLQEALALLERKSTYTTQAGLGPWSRLDDRVKRLQILDKLGEYEQVLADVEEMLSQIRELDDKSAADESIPSWHIREVTLEIGVSAAQFLRWWELAQALNAEIVTSMTARGASEFDLAQARFGGSGALIGLGRLDEAERLMIECQPVLEREGDADTLSDIFNVRAQVEYERGQPSHAASSWSASLRHGYIQPKPKKIAQLHCNLATCLVGVAERRSEQRAHRLAGALIPALAGMNYEYAISMHNLVLELAEADPETHETISDVTTEVERTEGVHFAALITVLSPDSQETDKTLTTILMRAHREANIRRHIDEWEPVITAVATAAAAIEHSATSPDWAALTTVLRRILSGERDERELTMGLDEIDAAIAQEVLGRLEDSSE